MQQKHLVDRELVKARGIFSFREFRAEDYRPGAKPLRDWHEVGQNLILEVGNDLALNILAGISGTAFTNANALLGVGNGTTAADRADTGLVGLSTEFEAMSPGYPALDAETHAMVWRSVFFGGDANFAWAEAVLKSDADGVCLNRVLFDAVEIKTAANTWELNYSLQIF